VIDAAGGWFRHRPGTLHFLTHGIATVDSVCIKLNSDLIRVETVQKDFDFKEVVVRAGFDLQVSKAQPGPFLLQCPAPVNYLFALRSFIGSTFPVG
jgi:hypothetical protein